MLGSGGDPRVLYQGQYYFLIAENRPAAVPQGYSAQACQGSETNFREGKKAGPKDCSLPSCHFVWKIRRRLGVYTILFPLPLPASFPSRKGAVNVSNLGILVSAPPEA